MRRTEPPADGTSPGGMLPDTRSWMFSMLAPPQPKDLIGSKDSAMKEGQIAGVLTPILAQFGLELEAVEVIPAGKRRLLRVVVDGDGPQGTGPLLDDIAEASKVASAALDKADVAGTAAYTFEMTSRGVGRPLELPRHWRRNAGRLVTVRLAVGDTITGRIVSNTEEGVRLNVDGEDRQVSFADVDRALIQVELNRPKVARSEEEEG
jgi:ribosome maturation factor RimP